MWLLAVIARNLSPTCDDCFCRKMNCPPKSNRRARFGFSRAQLELEEIIKTPVFLSAVNARPGGLGSASCFTAALCNRGVGLVIVRCC